MTAAKRDLLPSVSKNTPLHHPGLALNRYLSKTDDKHDSAKNLFEAAEFFVPNEADKTAVELWKKLMAEAGQAYRTAFYRWEKTMREAGVVAFSMELAGPLAVGLGNASPMEIGLTTHHTYGMPTIPGSALKGMCARAAREFMKGGTIDCKQYEAMFGDTNSAAYLTFWDAWYDPGSVNGLPFHRDVITVHHPDYYSSGGKKEGKECWPTDFDDPVPIPFLVVRPGARFCFALSIPDEWRNNEKDGCDFASKLLQYALCNLGVGGKTNAGYGYFNDKSLYIQPLPPKPPREEVWEGCTITKRQNKGAVEVTIKHDDRVIVLVQNKWQEFERELAIEIKEQLKKKPLIADVSIRIHGGETTVIRITSKELGGKP